MKRRLSTILTCLIVGTLTACGGSKKKDDPKPVVPTDVSITTTVPAAGFFVGDELTFAARVLPAEADQTVTWSTSEPTVLSVTSAGLVKALKAGESDLFAKTVNNLTATYHIEVKAHTVAPESIAITTTLPEEGFFVGDELQFEAEILPENADKTITWSVSNSTVLSISESGLVKALAAGMSTVRANTVNKIRATYQVTVREFIQAETIEVGKESNTLTADGGFHYMDAVVGPEDATNKKISYTSSNEDVATVDESGMVTAKEAGKAVITATSVSNPNLSATTEITVAAGKWNNYSVEDMHTSTKADFQDVQRADGIDAMPVGKSENIEVLVIPYEFSDYPFEQRTLDDLDALFNGNGAEDTRYWESVSSYYNKASYGKVNIHATIAPVYKTSDEAAKQKGAGYSVSALRTAYADYLDKTGTNGKQFDSDGNGYADAVYMIYSAKDYSKVSSLDNELFWAYVYWNTYDKPNVANPKTCVFMWASYDFMYESGTSRVDAHTFVHESGHIMGANDYYNYNKASYQAPLGGIDMMDYNIGSHNVWTKMAYGWIDPIYVTGDAKIEITSAQSVGDAIIIAPDSWNHQPFDEMLIMELSTPTGLNELDATTPYSSRPKVYDEAGIKLYHVDTRLARGGDHGLEYAPSSITRSEIISGGYFIPAANTDNSERNKTPEFFYEVGLIQSGKKATMYTAGKDGENSDLFHTGDYFRFSDYHEFFQCYPTLNNGETIDYEIRFDYVGMDKAVITVQKVAQSTI